MAERTVEEGSAIKPSIIKHIVRLYVNIFAIKFAESRLNCLHVEHLVY